MLELVVPASMWNHADVDRTPLPLSTLAMAVLFLPFILASVFFRLLRLFSPATERRAVSKLAKPLEKSVQSLSAFVNKVASGTI